MNLSKANLVLVAIAAALAVPTWLTYSGERELYVDVGAVPRMFEGFQSDSVAQLILGSPRPAAAPAQGATTDPKKPTVEHDMLVIARTDKGFMIGQVPGMGQTPPPNAEIVGAPVNKDLLEAQIWKHLGEIRLDKQTLVQPDATDAQLAEYGLDEANAFVIQAKNASGAIVADLLVGKDAGGKMTQAAVRGTFCRKRDSHDVVLYEPGPQSGLLMKNLKPDFWLDRALAKIAPDKIKSLSVRNVASGGRTLQFTRGDGKGVWTAVQPPEEFGALRQQEVETMAQRFAFVACQDFKRPLASANLKALGLEPPQLELRVVWQDGSEEKTLALDIGTKVDGKNEYYLRSSTSAFLLTWASHFVAAFEKDPKDWFDPKAIQVDPVKDVPQPAPTKAEAPTKTQSGPGGPPAPAQPAPAQTAPAQPAAKPQPAGKQGGEPPAAPAVPAQPPAGTKPAPANPAPAPATKPTGGGQD